MDCAQKDAFYLKLLLVETYANQDTYNNLVPNKISLDSHVGVVAVEGIAEAAMIHKIELKGKKTTLMSHILMSDIGVDSVEETNHTAESGK
eukprot:9346343-Ditylum_brightwellii.AAC.1